jgi:hypothetical protein
MGVSCEYVPFLSLPGRDIMPKKTPLEERHIRHDISLQPKVSRMVKKKQSRGELNLSQIVETYLIEKYMEDYKKQN